MKPKCNVNTKKSKEFVNLARLLRIIGDENRLRIMFLLKDGERCVCEIYPNLGLSQNLVSSHLKVMRDFGVLAVRREWKRNYYSINESIFKMYDLSLVNFFKKYE